MDWRNLILFFQIWLYGYYEETVVSDVGGVDSGRFFLLSFWEEKWGLFSVEGGINSLHIISSSIAC